MGKVLRSGEYGVINGHIFYDINFDRCKNETKLSNNEIRIRLFNSSEINFILKGDVEIDYKIFELYTDVIHYYGDCYEIDFAIEVRSGILYVLEVSLGPKNSGKTKGEDGRD